MLQLVENLRRLGIISWDLITFIVKKMRKLAFIKATFSIIEHSVDGPMIKHNLP